MNATSIGKNLDKTLLRYKSGLIDTAQAKQELKILMASLKTREQEASESLNSNECALEGLVKVISEARAEHKAKLEAEKEA